MGKHSQLPATPHRYRNVLRASPLIFAGVLWFAMMFYFLLYYLNLPRLSNGKLPHISDDYGLFPYISDIGSIRMGYFKAFAFFVAIFFGTGVIVDLYLFRTIQPGSWYRRVKGAFALVACIFLVALTFESVQTSHTLHLVLTSINIWSMGLSKVAGWLQNIAILRAVGRERHLVASQKVRATTLIIGLPSAILCILGMYDCKPPISLLHSDICWKLTSVSAPGEWVLSLSWISFMFVMGYDIYHAEKVCAYVDEHWREYLRTAALSQYRQSLWARVVMGLKLGRGFHDLVGQEVYDAEKPPTSSYRARMSDLFNSGRKCAEKEKDGSMDGDEVDLIARQLQRPRPALLRFNTDPTPLRIYHHPIFGHMQYSPTSPVPPTTQQGKWRDRLDTPLSSKSSLHSGSANELMYEVEFV